MKKLFALALLVSVLGIAVSGQAHAATTTYYVGTNGKDTNAGTSSKPWRTIQKATSTAPAGATIIVTSGTYDPFTVSKVGQTVTNQVGQTVSIKGNTTAQDVIRIAASNVTVVNLTVYGCVPKSTPTGGFEENGSSGVRINDGASYATVKGLTIRDGRGTNANGLPFGCYGVFVHNANTSTITGNNIYGNGQGIFFNGGGISTVVANNQIHDNNVIIRNTPGNNDDFGGGGITFGNITAAPGPVASGNTIINNFGPSADYGRDGGAFEIYNASNVTMTGNTIANNENVLETGTFAGGTCANNSFTNNTAKGRTTGSTLDWSKGMILRCAANMVVTGNTFNAIDWWVYDVEVDYFSGSVNGLRITNNTVTQSQKVYHLGVDPVANNMVVDTNRFHFDGGIFASYADGTTSPSLTDWQIKSGLDLASTTF